MKQKSLKRFQRLTIFVAVAAIGLYGAYASRRTPVEPQQGTGLQWALDSAQVAGNRIRIATYNIHRGKGVDDIRDLNRVAQVVQHVDLVALNEVAGPAFFGQVDQAEALGRAIKSGWLFAPNQRRWHRYHFGNALLSRIEIGAWSQEPLVYDRQQSRSHRNLLKTQIQLGQQPVTVLATHIDRGAIRSVQLKFVLQLFTAHTPAILLGDFNTTEDDSILAGYLQDPNNVDAIGAALGGADPQKRVDWIITRGLSVLEGGMHPVGISDHPFFWVDVTLPVPNLNLGLPLTITP
ncbi:endonuclease/exonuclease/phosphatase family protein [Planctomycetota bacterium]